MAKTLRDPRGKKEQAVSLVGRTIEIVVGSDETSFHVHEGLIRAHSPFFETALSKYWKEVTERKVKLPEDDPQAFSGYTQWLYTNRVHTTGTSDRGLLPLSLMYALGEKLMDNGFQDRVLDALVCASRAKDADGLRWYPGEDVVSTIYEATPKGSPGRRYLVDTFVMHGQSKWISKIDTESHNKEFLCELAAVLLAKRVLPDDTKKDLEAIDVGVPCRYHKHMEDEPCGGTDE